MIKLSKFTKKFTSNKSIFWILILILFAGLVLLFLYKKDNNNLVIYENFALKVQDVIEMEGQLEKTNKLIDLRDNQLKNANLGDRAKIENDLKELRAIGLNLKKNLEDAYGKALSTLQIKKNDITNLDEDIKRNPLKENDPRSQIVESNLKTYNEAKEVIDYLNKK